MANLAIIPARGGSKRIHRKNIKNFLGKPIIAYSIEAAIKSRLFDEIMVSTDDAEIAEVALKYGARIPFLRSPKNSDDFASTMDVIDEVLTQYRKDLHKSYEFVCCIYPTAPLIQHKHLSEGLTQLVSKHRSAVFPVVSFSYPVWRGVSIDNEGKAGLVWPEYKNTRSQDLSSVYHDAGQWYWFNTSNIQNGLFTDNTGTVILSETEAQDIDTITDWEMAEYKYKMLTNEKNSI